MTKQVMKKVWGAIFIGITTTPITVLLDPSNALTISSLSFITSPLMVNLAREPLGITLREGLVSTKTLDRIVSMQLIEMHRSLLWFLPSAGSSTSLKLKLRLTGMLLTTPSNFHTEISYGTWAIFKNLTKATLFASEHINKDNIKIFDGVWLSCSTTQ